MQIEIEVDFIHTMQFVNKCNSNFNVLMEIKGFHFYTFMNKQRNIDWWKFLISMLLIWGYFNKYSNE